VRGHFGIRGRATTRSGSTRRSCAACARDRAATRRSLRAHDVVAAALVVLELDQAQLLAHLEDLGERARAVVALVEARVEAGGSSA
jgi:hypothetical protein